MPAAAGRADLAGDQGVALGRVEVPGVSDRLVQQIHTAADGSRGEGRVDRLGHTGWDRKVREVLVEVLGRDDGVAGAVGDGCDGSLGVVLCEGGDEGLGLADPADQELDDEQGRVVVAAR